MTKQTPPSTGIRCLKSVLDFYVNGAHQVIWLQHFTGGWDKWEEKAETTPCSGHTPYTQTSSGTWKGRVFRSREMTVERFRCVSVMGFTSTLIPEVVDRKSILVEHFEVVMHKDFGGLEYWKVNLEIGSRPEMNPLECSSKSILRNWGTVYLKSLFYCF